MCLKSLSHSLFIQEGRQLVSLSGVDLGIHNGRSDMVSLPRLGYKSLQLKSCLCSHSFFLFFSWEQPATHHQTALWREPMLGEFGPRSGLGGEVCSRTVSGHLTAINFDLSPGSAPRLLTYWTCQVINVSCSLVATIGLICYTAVENQVSHTALQIVIVLLHLFQFGCPYYVDKCSLYNHFVEFFFFLIINSCLQAKEIFNEFYLCLAF